MDDEDLHLKPTWRPLAPAECFKVMVQSHVAGVAAFEHRRKGAQLCLYAWDIALFPGRQVRDERIEWLWRTCKPQTGDQANGMPVWFREQVSDLVARKRDLLPTVTTFLTNAKLDAVDGATDRLIVTTEASTDEFLLLWRPDPTGTPSFGQRLRRLANETEELSDWVFNMRRQLRLAREDAAEVAMVCGARRIQLAGYRRLAVRWNRKQTAPSAMRVTAEWVRMDDEIDGQLKGVLAALA